MNQPQFTTGQGGVMQGISQEQAQAAAEHGYRGVAGGPVDTQAAQAAEATKPAASGLSKEANAFLVNQYNLHITGLQPGQREYAEKVLLPMIQK